MARSIFVIPLIVGAAQFMHQFDGSVIATALPSMAASLDEDPIRLNLAITSYLLALAVFVPVSGWMADRFGGRRVFIWAIVVFTVSSVMCGLAHSLIDLVIYRTLQGIGGAMMAPVGRVIVVKSVPKLQLVQAMNYITMPAVLGPLLGPSVGGFIVTYFSWPWIFFINLPIGLTGLLLAYRFIPDIREEKVSALDLRGFILLGLALAGLVFGFEAMGRGVLPLWIVFTSLGAGAICTGLYLIHERRTAEPIIDLSLLRIRTFSASIFGGGLFYMGSTAAVFLLALLLQIGLGLSAFQAGLTTLAVAAGSLVIRFAFRLILRPLGFRRLLIGNAVLTGCYLIVCGMFRDTTPFFFIVLVLLVGGFSRSIQFTASQSLAYAELPPALLSRATSFSAMAQQLSQSFGVGLVALIMHLSLIWHDRSVVTPQDVGFGYFAIGALALASAIIFYLLPTEAGAELSDR